MGMISGPGSRWLITLQVAFPRLWISILRVWYSHQSYSILFNLEMHTLCIPHSYNEFRYRWAWSVTTVTLHGWRGQAQRPSIYGVITDALEIHVVLVPFWPKQKKMFLGSTLELSSGYTFIANWEIWVWPGLLFGEWLAGKRFASLVFCLCTNQFDSCTNSTHHACHVGVWYRPMNWHHGKQWLAVRVILLTRLYWIWNLRCYIQILKES